MKKSMSLILALVMVLAMSCGAWAATITETVVSVDTSATYGKHIDTAGDLLIVSPDGVHVEGAATSNATGVHMSVAATANIYGGVTLSAGGSDNRGLNVGSGSEVTITGDVVVSAGGSTIGVNSAGGSNVTINDNVIVSGGTSNSGAVAVGGSFVVVKKNVEVSDGSNNNGVRSGTGGGSVIVEGDVNVTGGEGSKGVSAQTEQSTVTLLGDLNISGGKDVYGAVIIDGATVAMENGNITMTDESQTGFLLSDDANLVLDGVTADAEGLALFVSDSSGNIDAIDSALKGNIIQDGSEAGTVDITLTDSTWNGAAEAIDDIGAIDITLENSNWNITASSDTNGKVTADSDSNIDFRGTDENIVVEIDKLAGDPGLNIKLGDEFIIKNPDSIPTSSNPDVIEIVENPDGSVSIIPKKDGEAELTYSYIDENNKVQTVTIGVVSGSGSKPSGGGGSSGCNAGFGVLALLGLAFVYKKK